MSNPRPSSSRDDLTWLEFLAAEDRDQALRFMRNTSPSLATDPSITVTSSTSSSQERKRRHAGSSPERRGPPYPNFQQEDARARRAQGSSRESAIDLTSPSPPTRHQQLQYRPSMASPPPPRSGSSSESMRVRGLGRAGSINTVRGIINPAITAPRRDSDFVLPRWQPDAAVTSCPVCEADFHIFYRKHHCRKCGRVVCAACSPHRITIPRQYIVRPPGAEGDRERDEAPMSPGSSGAAFGRNLGGGEVVRVCNPCVPDPWTPEAAAAAPPTDPRHAPGRRPSDHTHLVNQFGSRYRHLPVQSPSPPPDMRPRAHTHQSQPSSTNFSRSAPQRPAPPTAHSLPHGPIIPPRQQRAQAAPRREIPEEDECPVCGIELPADRESHIQACITARFSTSTPSSLPTTTALASPTVPISDTTTRTRAGTSSYRPRGMAVYLATEKDCVDGDGQAVECVICLEEFVVGEEMGRMECLCRFHRACIRGWWDARGVGCPTHQVYE